MKNIFKFSALFCAMTLLVTSCSQDAMFEPEEPQYKPAVVGDEIIFGSRAGFENATPGTRTVYSGETYKVGNVEFERIDWVNDDLVEIYCSQAAGEKAFTYKVTRRPDNETGEDENGNEIDSIDYAYLSKIDENSNGLAWGSDEDHYFYAMYPSVEQIKEKTENPDITVVQGIKMDSTILRGIVPVSQPGIELDESSATKVLKPNMDYAYMAAHATAKKKDGAVTLNFVPIVTALEIELKTNGVDTKISDIRVEGPGVSGSFSADLSYDAWGEQTYPTCVNGDEYVQDYITIPLPKTVELNATNNESLKFTVFLRPGVDYSSLTVRYTETGQAWPAKILGDGNAKTTKDNIIAQKKNVVTNFKLTNKKFEIDASHWLDQLPDDRKMGYLSLPGTGGSFSYKYSNTSYGNYYRQQNTDMTFEAQWKAGIRAFELVVDRPSDTDDSLGDENLTCNKTSVGEKFGNAMASIRNKVSTEGEGGKKECAVVVVTYQPEGAGVLGIGGRPRNVSNFATAFAKWWGSLSDTDKNTYKLYTPDAILGDMRGKVMVLLRIDQQDESEDGNITTATNTINGCTNSEGCPFVIIKGCGTAKDRWGARGYKIGTNLCAHISNNKSGDANVIENHMTGNTGLVFSNKANAEGFVSATSPKDSSYTISRPAFGDEGRGGLLFNYATNAGFECWYQEWARVVKTPIYNHEYGTWLTTRGTISWFESLNEKKSNIEQTFKMAIFSDPSRDDAMVYINSLSGYLATTAFNDSCDASVGSTYGGSGGDVAGLASELNPWFAELVFNAGLEQATGPTGVIFMDYVTPEMEVIGRIISNNFKSSVTN